MFLRAKSFQLLIPNARTHSPSIVHRDTALRGQLETQRSELKCRYATDVDEGRRGLLNQGRPSKDHLSQLLEVDQPVEGQEWLYREPDRTSSNMK